MPAFMCMCVYEKVDGGCCVGRLGNNPPQSGEVFLFCFNSVMVSLQVQFVCRACVCVCRAHTAGVDLQHHRFH